MKLALVLYFLAICIIGLVKPKTTKATFPKECGMFTPGRIVNGTKAKQGEFPHQALMLYNKGFLCGASIITKSFILTAAHCVEHPKQPTNYQFEVGNITMYGAPSLNVTSLKVHPEWNTTTYQNDIALFRLKEPLTFNKNIQPVCMPNATTKLTATGTISGWGNTAENGSTSETLLKVTLPIVSNVDCAKGYDDAGFTLNITDHQLCAGLKSGGKDSCQGDSGGPMVMIGPNNRYFQPGIVSFGDGCGQPNGPPGVYTRVRKFRQWILETMDEMNKP